MDPRTLTAAIASLRAEVGEDSLLASKCEVRVKLPAGFIARGWQEGTTYDAAIVGGFRSKATAVAAAPGIVAEIAAKLANAVLCPEVDPPHCNTGVAWLRIKVQP